MLIGAHVSPAGRPPQGDRARRRARLHSDPDLQPVAADVETDGLRRGGLRGVPRGDGGEPDRGGPDPRRLPAQLRQRGRRHQRQIARFADPLAARRARDRGDGVVLHPGSAKTGDVGDARSPAPARRFARRSPTARAASCISRTRPAPAARWGAPSRSSPTLIEAAGDRSGSGVCLDSCHLLASGYDIRTPPGWTRRCATARRELGPGRIRSLHLNDSQTPLGSNRDRHANIGEGELGEKRLRCIPLGARPPAAALHPRDARREPRRARPRGSRPGGRYSRAARAGRAPPSQAPEGSYARERRRRGGRRVSGVSALSSSASSVGVWATRKRSPRRSRRGCRRPCRCRSAPRPRPGSPRSPA